MLPLYLLQERVRPLAAPFQIEQDQVWFEGNSLTDHLARVVDYTHLETPPSRLLNYSLYAIE